MNLLKSPHYHKIQENSKKRFLKRKKTQKSESSVEIELEAKENLAQIGVYFQSLNTKLTYEKPKYEVRNLRARVICTSLYWINPSKRFTNMLFVYYISACIHYYVCSRWFTFFVSWYLCVHDVWSTGISCGYSDFIVFFLCNKPESSGWFLCIILSYYVSLTFMSGFM